MSDKKRCAKRVFSGERWDTGGHMCGNPAQPSSDFCKIHQPGYTKSAGTAPAKAPGMATTARRVTYFASLQWDAGHGPLITIPYSGRSGYITHARAQAVDDGAIEYRVVGVHAKKDGTVGATRWDSKYHYEQTIPDEYRAQLAALIEEQRS